MRILKISFSAIMCFYVLPAVLLLSVMERAEVTGRTDLSKAAGWGGDHPNDNYAVFRKARYVQIVTSFTPQRIMERDGQLVRAQAVINHGYPLWTYVPATPKEQALWLDYFEPKSGTIIIAKAGH